MSGYQFINLTRAVSDKESPLRRYLDAEYPRRKLLTGPYRASAGPLLVDSHGAASGTIGAAFDFLVRFAVDPTYSDGLMYRGLRSVADHVDAVQQVIAEARRAAITQSTADRDDLYRACWALALTTEVYRIGVWPDGQIDRLIRTSAFSSDALMDCAPAEALVELRRLDETAAVYLSPELDAATTFVLGPTFTGSELCQADADLIVDGCLIELKTKLRSKNKRTGERTDVLETKDLYQLISYALFDTNDAYGIDRLALYSARYGTFAAWHLADALGSLAGRRVDINEERQRVWEILSG